MFDIFLYLIVLKLHLEKSINTTKYALIYNYKVDKIIKNSLQI